MVKIRVSNLHSSFVEDNLELLWVQVIGKKRAQRFKFCSYCGHQLRPKISLLQNHFAS
jgi:hypothetical protein